MRIMQHLNRTSRSMTAPHRVNQMKCVHRPGVTFLEAVFSVMLLSMVVTTLSSAVAFFTQSQKRMDQKLGAGELANRLILQYMDEQDSLPDRSLPIEYDVDYYRWTLQVDPVRFEFDNQVDDDNGSVGGGVSLNRIKLITVKVWLAADSGGSRSFTSNVPNSVITRLIDPLAFNNPDSFQTLLEKPGGFEKIIESLLDLEEGS